MEHRHLVHQQLDGGQRRGLEHHRGRLSQQPGRQPLVHNADGAPPPVTAPPTNTQAPVITGQAEVGQTLTCTTGAWTANPVNGKRVRVSHGKRLTAPVDLRGLPKGRFAVRMISVTRTGKRLQGTRRYRTCAPKPDKPSKRRGSRS